MHVWTETPVATIWSHLRYFEAPANVRNLLTGATRSLRQVPWPPTEETNLRADEVASCIRQASEYFAASRMVGLATSPLLQFYCAQALAKAAILCSDPNVTLVELRYHGLSTRPSTAGSLERGPLQAYASTPADWTLEREFAVVNEGVFPHLARVVGDSVPRTGAVLHLQELLRLVPELAEVYQRHYGESSHCFPLYSKAKRGEPFAVWFQEKSLGDILAVFPELSTDLERHDDHDQPGFRRRDGQAEAPPWAKIVRHSVAGHFLVRPHPCLVYKPLSVLFASSFIMSNIVRYKPAFWMRALDGAASGTVGILEQLCTTIERRFAHDILECIWQERFSFGSPGYLA